MGVREELRKPWICVLGLVLISSWFGLTVMGQDREVPVKEDDPIVACQVPLVDNPFRGFKIVVFITGTKTIEDCVIKPIENSKPDQSGDKHPYVGKLEWEYKSGKKKAIHLYAPIGYFEMDNKHYVGDFDNLRSLIVEYLKEAPKALKLEKKEEGEK